MTTEDLAPTDVKSETQVTESQVQASPTPAEAAAPQADTKATEPETSTGKGEAEHAESRANARIRALVEEKKAANAAAEAAKQRESEARATAEALKRQLDALKPQPAGDERSHPDQASYVTAIAKEAAIEAQRFALQQQADQAERLAAESKQRAYDARVNEFMEKAPDYHQVTGNPNLQITPLMADAIKESENGAAIAYFLGKNPAEASRIAGMSPISQAAAIGRLEAKVTLPERRTSSAPAPVKTVTGGKGVTEPDPGEMSMDDYRKWRGAQ